MKKIESKYIQINQGMFENFTMAGFYCPPSKEYFIFRWKRKYFREIHTIEDKFLGSQGGEDRIFLSQGKKL